MGRNACNEYSFPKARRIYFLHRKVTRIAGILSVEIIFINFLKCTFMSVSP